jgi:fatty acid desaturase
MSDTRPRPIAWYRVPIAKEKLKELTSRSDARGALQSVPYLVLLALTGTAAVYAQRRLSLPVFLVLLFVHGTFWAYLLNGFHELVHGTVFKTRWLNAAFLRVFAFLSWNSHVQFRASHVRHHASTLHPPDDEEVVLPIRLRLPAFLLSAVIDLPGIYTVLRDTVLQALGVRRTRWEWTLFPKGDRAGLAQRIRWAWLTLLGHGFVIAASVLTGWWPVAVVISGARFYGGWLQWLCNNTQHTGLQDNVADFRLCCRTIHLNPFLRYLYFQMSYHTEHHMYAAVPCYNLGKLHAQIRSQMPPISGGLVPAWREIIGILRIQEKQPGYQHTFPLPPPAAV